MIDNEDRGDGSPEGADELARDDSQLTPFERYSKKRVDEEWKERAEEEKRRIDETLGAATSSRSQPEAPVARDATSQPAADSGAAEATPDELLQEQWDDAEFGEAPDQQGAPPRVSFLSLLSQLAAQAASGLGQYPDPRTGQRYLDLDLARDTIEMLAVLEEKTRGNLDSREKATLDDLLQQLHLAYTSVARAAQEQMMQQDRARFEEGLDPRG